MTKTTKPDVAAEALRKRILEDYQLDNLGTQILENALNAYVRLLQARDRLDREGLTVVDRFKQVRPHPCYEQEAVARASFLRHIAALGLQLGDMGNEDNSTPRK